MSHQGSTIRRVGIAAVLAVCWTWLGMVWAGPPEKNPGQPFAEILKAIRGITQNWDKKLDATNGDANGCNSDRFTCLFDDTVVRDNETGIVWDRSPDTTNHNWNDAIQHCANREVGGRKGFHVPLVEQLATLVDTNSDLCTGGGICLPDGHPFQNIAMDADAAYWSATSIAGDLGRGAWFVAFGPNWQGRVLPNGKDVPLLAWCARGGQSYDGQDLNGVAPN